MGIFWKMARGVISGYGKMQRDNQKLTELNEKWDRLNQCLIALNTDFLQPLFEDDPLTVAEHDRLAAALEKAVDWKEAINANVEHVGRRELSQYATSIKSLTLLTFKHCKKYSVFSDIESVRYNTATKTVLLNEQPLFYLG